MIDLHGYGPRLLEGALVTIELPCCRWCSPSCWAW
jgi:hypothetical protein